MAFQLSPGVNVSEIDLTTVVPSVLTTAGAFAGQFPWGPVGQLTLVDSEITLSNIFAPQGPTTNSAVSFFTAASFLAYGNNLTVVRAANTTSTFNSTANTQTTVYVNNPTQFQYVYLGQNNGNAYGAFVGKYPGAIGNSLTVSVCDTATQFSTWTYSSYFTSAPGTSAYVSSLGGANDEIHIAVVDAGGLFTGTKGTVLETYPFVSKAVDAVNLFDGSSNYYKQVVFNKSNYVYAIDPPSYSTTSSGTGAWGSHSANTSFIQLSAVQTLPLVNGADGTPTDGDIITAYGLFTNKEQIDISLIRVLILLIHLYVFLQSAKSLELWTSPLDKFFESSKESNFPFL